MKNFFQGVKKGLSKIGQGYKKFSDKDPRVDTIATISGIMIFAFLVMGACQSIMSENAVTIATNKAEGFFLEGNYESAIAEYEKLQEDMEWPIYKAKIAEIYSVQGEYEKSNSLLEEVYIQRNALIDENGRDEYKDEDPVLGNLIALTSLMNGDSKKALEYGELFISENVGDKTIQRTMFTIYMVNGENEKAHNLIKDYKVDKEDSYDLALYARMNMLVDDYDTGYEILKEAWYKNKDEIKVYDVIAQIAAYNRDQVIEDLTLLSEGNPDELCYKLWLAKCYSMLAETTNEADALVQEVAGKDVGNIVFKTIVAKVEQHKGNNEEAEKILNAIMESDNNSFFGYHIAAWYYYDLGDYDKAFEYCKNSILANKDYPDNYGFLIPEIMIKKDQSKIAEPYFRMAIEKEPFNYNIMLKIADYYNYTSYDSEKAFEYYNIASLIKPTDSEIMYNMAHIKIDAGDEATAIELLKKCTALDETSTKYHRALGTVYMNAGNEKEAIKSIRASYAVDKSDVLTLNNAAIYYIYYEGNVGKAMANMTAAYDMMTDATEAEAKSIISENYEKLKTFKKEYDKEEGKKLTVPDLVLFY